MQITLAHGTSTVSRRLTGSHAQALNPSWVAASRQSPLAGNAMLLTPAARQHNPVSSTTECVCLHHTFCDVSIIFTRSMTAKVSDLLIGQLTLYGQVTSRVGLAECYAGPHLLSQAQQCQ